MAIETICGVPSRNPRCHKQLGLVKTLGFPSHVSFPSANSPKSPPWDPYGPIHSSFSLRTGLQVGKLWLLQISCDQESCLWYLTGCAWWDRFRMCHGVGSIWKMIHDDFQWFQDVPSWFWWFWYCNCDVFCVGIGSICSQKAFWVWSSPVMAFARWKTGMLG